MAVRDEGEPLRLSKRQRPAYFVAAFDWPLRDRMKSRFFSQPPDRDGAEGPRVVPPLFRRDGPIDIGGGHIGDASGRSGRMPSACLQARMLSSKRRASKYATDRAR